MKIWLSKNSEVPIYEQITTQIILGVASGELEVGQKLPATREIARRCHVHANTVSNAYRKLAEQGWLEFRKGSGFYVCRTETGTPENSLDRLIAEFFQTAQKNGFSVGEIKSRLEQFFEARKANEILLVESDAQLRAILAEEIRQATNREVSEASFEDFKTNYHNSQSVFAAMFDETAKIQSVLSPGKTCVSLKMRSVSEAMKDKQRPSADDLVAVVSGWEKFLLLAKTMLVAAQVDAESLIVRNTERDDWQNGLNSASMIICDTLAAKKIANLDNLRPFRLIADESLEQLRQFG